jgi:hypothetical protein
MGHGGLEITDLLAWLVSLLLSGKAESTNCKQGRDPLLSVPHPHIWIYQEQNR